MRRSEACGPQPIAPTDEAGRLSAILQGLIESISDGVLLFSQDGKVLGANRRLAEMWNLPDNIFDSRDPLLSLAYVLDQVVDRDGFAAKATNISNMGECADDVIDLLDGRVFERRCHPLKLGELTLGRICIFRDITSQRQMEKSLRWQAAFLKAQSESTMEGILVVDNEGRKLLANGQLARTWRLPQEIIDNPDDSAQLEYVVGLTTSPEQFLEKVTYLYSHPDERSRDEIEFKDGTVLDRYSAPVVGDDGTHYGRIWSFRDVTELVRTRRAAEAASVTKSLFLANMSHEIRTPLNAVIALTSLLLDRDIDADSLDTIRTIQSSGDTLLRVINDLLDFSKIEAGRLEIETSPTDIGKVVEDVVALYQAHAKAGNTLLRSVAPKTYADNFPCLGLDPVRIRQILSNLVSNALKFTLGGEVIVSWNASLEGKSACVDFSVKDTGIGIPSEKLDTIFESFTQADISTHRKYGGTGLGLTICKRLLELMGGKIWVISEAGCGAEFHVQVPADIVETPDILIPTGPEGPTSFKGLRILLAEDNVINVKVALKILERTGSVVDVAENGLVAIEKVLKNNYDLVLMDVMMPVCDGLEATKTIRQHMARQKGRHLPIVALTANALKGDRETCIEAGMDDFLAKPFTCNLLEEMLFKWLGSREGGLTRYHISC